MADVAEMRWAVITGAGTGLGRALAKRLIKENVKVVAIGRREEPLRILQQEHPDFVVPLGNCDISDQSNFDRIRDAIDGEKLHFLIQNAAVGLPDALENIKWDDFEYALRVNVTAPLFLTQALLPKLKLGGGRILHLGTGVADMAQLGTASYGVSKKAFQRLWQQLVVELKETPVSCGSVRPGIVKTEGLYEHYDIAKSKDLPHVNYFDYVFKEGEDNDINRVISFFHWVLTGLTEDEFQSKEWVFGEKSHWPRWDTSETTSKT